MEMPTEAIEYDPGTCVEGTTWDAVEAVGNATVWRTAMQEEGLNLVLKNDTYVVEDLGLYGVLVVPDMYLSACNDVSVYSCLVKTNDWSRRLVGKDAGLLLVGLLQQPVVEENATSGLVKFESLLVQGQSPSAGGDAGKSYERVVGVVNGTNDGYTDTRILESFMLPYGQVPNATDFSEERDHVDVIQIVRPCDSSLPSIYVVNGVLRPPNLQESNIADSVTALEDYCNTSIVKLVDDAQAYFPFEALQLFAYQSIPPLLNPETNITLFVPNLRGVLEPSFVGASAKRNQDEDITLFLLTHILEGGYCPEELIKAGSLSALSGVYANESYSLSFSRDPENENVVFVQLDHGSQQGTVYNASYIGQACYSNVYSLNTLMMPWDLRTDNVSGLNPDYLSRIPKVSSQEDLFDVQENCMFIDGTQMGDVNTTGSSSLSGGAIAGIVVGSVVGCCLLALLFLLGWKRWKKLKSKTILPDTYDEENKPCSAQQAKELTESDSFSRMSSSNVQLPWDDLMLRSEDFEFIVDTDGARIILGQGKFGKVFLGKLFTSEDVAIKCIQDETLNQMFTALDDRRRDKGIDIHKKSARERVLSEVALLKACRSQYVVSFLGACFLDNEVQLVTELMPSGDLWSALRSEKISWYRGGAKVAMDVAAGLSYLHNRRVIHLDLKSSNILLKYQGVETGSEEEIITYNAKIADVGLAKMLPPSREYLASVDRGGTWNWCAPEVIMSQRCTPAADMWSYGVVLWELCTMEIPMRGRMREIRVPEECPQAIADFITRCNHVDPSERPTAAEAVEFIQNTLK